MLEPFERGVYHHVRVRWGYEPCLLFEWAASPVFVVEWAASPALFVVCRGRVGYHEPGVRGRVSCEPGVRDRVGCEPGVRGFLGRVGGRWCAAVS
jgi:hypothetical protein